MGDSLLEKSRNTLRRYKMYEGFENKIKNLFYKKRFFARFHHNPHSFNLKAKLTGMDVSVKDDAALIERLKKFYTLCDANFGGNKNSQWTDIFMKRHGDIHLAFINNDDKVIIDVLRHPYRYNLFYGFENLNRDLLTNKRLEDILEPQMALDTLLSFCEAAGLIATANPESLKIVKSLEADELINLLENKLNISITFPNPFEKEYGVLTTRGIVSYRAAQALYQAWQIYNLVKHIPNPRILEIGGGLGRTAYFCKLFGINDYTIVDIPISSIAQGNFIGRTLPEDNLYLLEEPINANGTDAKIKLIHPKAFYSSQRDYDLIVNFDSLTELDINIATDYFNKIATSTKLFLSVNHENNSFTVHSVWEKSGNGNKLSRNPSWVRRGYVEELISFS